MRPIDADALKNHLEDLRSYTILGEEHPYYSGETNALSVAIQNIDNAPTVDAVPVKHGRWINIANGNCDDLCKCSECNETWLGIGGYNYCPNCGAKMDGERRESE